MKLSLDSHTARFLIRAYDNGTVRINDRDYRHSVVVSSERLLEHWAPQSMHELTLDDLEVVLAEQAEIVLLGTGRRTRLPPREVARHALQRGAALEAMDTGAACRTFNILVSEGRSVVAALMMID